MRAMLDLFDDMYRCYFYQSALNGQLSVKKLFLAPYDLLLFSHFHLTFLGFLFYFASILHFYLTFFLYICILSYVLLAYFYFYLLLFLYF